MFSFIFIEMTNKTIKPTDGIVNTCHAQQIWKISLRNYRFHFFPLPFQPI